MSLSKTIVINCAGVGSRLGFGHTKALLEIGGQTLIYHHLDSVSSFSDVRVVVGFDSQELVKIVLKKRRNIIIVFNHDYLNTGTLASLYKGSIYGQETIVSLDGDFLANPHDIKKFLMNPNEAVGYTQAYSDEPVYLSTIKKGDALYVTKLTREENKLEWTGVTQIKKSHLKPGDKHVYPMLNKSMPMLALKTDGREIDTSHDLVAAMAWARKVFS